GSSSDRNFSYKEKLRSGLVDIKKDDAVALFQSMIQSRPLPTVVDFSRLFTLSSIASAVAGNSGRVSEAVELVDRMVEMKVVPNLIILNTLVNGLCLQDRVSEAVALID
ncbi:unnamed protein product, partial [Brassica rapa]